LADQINVNSGGTRGDSGLGGVLAAILIIALIAFLVWAFAFGGFATLAGRPASSGAPATSNAPAGTTIDIKPNVNVNVPSGSQSAPSGGQSAPAKP
jgi:hypothetical protein